MSKIIPIESSSDTDAHHCAELEPFALRVVGDSMAPEFLDGHVIILDPGLPPSAGAYVVVDMAGEFIFRQYSTDGVRVFLGAVNAGYPEIPWTEGCRVVGVVVERVGARRRDRKVY